MKTNGKRRGMLLLICFAILAWPGFVFAGPVGKLVIAVPSLGSEKLDYSRGQTEATNTETVRAMTRRLIEFVDGKYAPGLAESWKMSPDGKIWDVYLRTGIKWHNGDTLTSQDVVFGVERMKRPEIQAGTQVAPLMDFIEKVEAVDDYHVRYHFKNPYPAFGYYSSLAPPMPKKYLEKVGDAVFNEKPIGMVSVVLLKRVCKTHHKATKARSHKAFPFCAFEALCLRGRTNTLLRHSLGVRRHC